MNFKESFPEIGVAAPNQFKVSAFDKMRHRELVLLGKAFGLSMDWELPMQEMIPMFKAEEAKGTFRKKPVDQLAWAMLSNKANPEQWPERPDTVKLEKVK